MRTRSVCWWLAFPVSVLAAQEGPDPMRYVPDDAILIVRTAGPAGWQRDLGATALGKALADHELTETWRRVRADTIESLGLSDDAATEIDKAFAALGGFDGEIVLSVKVDFESWTPDGEHPSWAVLVTMTGGGEFDFTSLREGADDWLPAATDTEVDCDGSFARLRQAAGVEWLGPFERDGGLFLLAGDRLEQQAEWFFGGAERELDRSALRKPTLAMQLPMRAALAAAMPMLEHREPDTDLSKMFGMIGVHSIETLTITTFPDEGYVGQSVVAELNENDRGLLPALFPKQNRPASALRWLPADAGTFSAGTLNRDEILRGYERLFVEFEDVLPFDREQLEQRVAAMLRIDIVDDLLAQIGDSYLVVQDLTDFGAVPDEDVPVEVEQLQDQVGNTCFVMPVRDGARLRKTLDTAIRARGLHVGRKRQQYAGQTIYRLNVLGMLPLEYAVTDTVLVLGIGGSEATERNVRGVLDLAAEAREQGRSEIRLPPAVRERLRTMPDGWSGIEVTSLLDLAEGMAAGLTSIEELLADPDFDQDADDLPWLRLMGAVPRVAAVLRRHDVGTTVAVDYFKNDRLEQRSRW